MIKDSIVGTWILVSVKAKNTKNDEILPFGDNPVGKIIYTADGDMSVVYMRANRPKFASGDPLGGTSKEIKQAFEGLDAYCGTYEIDTRKGVVKHHIEASRFPNWEGTTQVRKFMFLENQVQLSTTPIAFQGDEWVVDLVWKRKV